MTQLPEAGIVPPLSASEKPPPTAVTAPPQLFDTLGVAASSNWVGKLSVKATFVSGKLLLLFSWIRIRVAGPLPCRLVGVKVLLPVIALTPLTDNVAVAGETEPPILLDTLAIGMVLE